MKLKVKIKRLKPEAALPRYAHPGDVGLEFENGYAGIMKDDGVRRENKYDR